MENVTRDEAREAVFTVHKLKASNHIDDKMADIFLKCLDIIICLQEFGGDNKRSTTDMASEIGQTDNFVKIPTIKTVPKEGAHILPKINNTLDIYLSGGAKPLV